jgi:hypothetical protein
MAASAGHPLPASSRHIISMSPSRTAVTHDSSDLRGVAAYSGAAYSSFASPELPQPEMRTASSTMRQQDRPSNFRSPLAVRERLPVRVDVLAEPGAEPLLLSAIRVHYVDLSLLVPEGDEDDPSAVRRPRGEDVLAGLFCEPANRGADAADRIDVSSPSVRTLKGDLLAVG